MSDETLPTPEPAGNDILPRRLLLVPEATTFPFELYWMLKTLGARRLRFRLLQSISLSISLSTALLCWLSDNLREGLALVTHWLEKALVFSLLLACAAAFVLVAGFLDLTVRSWIDRLLLRRGYPASCIERLETAASAIWLSQLVLLPIASVSVVAVMRAPSARAASTLLGHCAGALIVTLVFGLLVAITVHFARRATHLSPRGTLVLLALGPELIRLFVPHFPTIRSLLETLPTLLFRCSL